MMKNNILSLLFFLVIYVITFRLISFILEISYKTYESSIIAFLVLEQTIVPFIFGLLFVLLTKQKNEKDIILVLVMPAVLLIAVLCVDYIEHSKLTIIYKYLFYIVALSQFLFCLFGGYIGYRYKYKQNKSNKA